MKKEELKIGMKVGLSHGDHGEIIEIFEYTVAVNTYIEDGIHLFTFDELEEL